MNYKINRMGFLAAKAMPDGMLAVAMYYNDTHVALMTLGLQSMTVTNELTYTDSWYGYRRVDRARPYRSEVDMEFETGEVVYMTREEFDSRMHNFETELPQYRPQLEAPR